MFGHQVISLPSPFVHDHRPQRLHTESARPQPIGPCHFTLHAGSKEHRCPCQGYQQNRGVPNSVCDCTHAACYHAQSTPSENTLLKDSMMSNGISIFSLLDRIRKLEEALQTEKEIRESTLARERQSWEREITILREALAPFYKSNKDMQQKLVDTEEKLDGLVKDQLQIKTRVMSIEDVGITLTGRGHKSSVNGGVGDPRIKRLVNMLGPTDASVSYSGSEGRTSASVEPMSPRQSTSLTTEPESPRSSGILNLVEYPRPPVPKYSLPPRLSPPAEPEEPRSSGFLALDFKDVLNRRKVVNGSTSTHAYVSPSSSTTKSPPSINGRDLTPQPLPRVSQAHPHLNGHVTEREDRAYKKRKHQAEHLALDVLADVSAASPVLS